MVQILKKYKSALRGGMNGRPLMFQQTLCFLLIIAGIFVLVWMHTDYCRRAEQISTSISAVIEPYTRMYADLDKVSSRVSDTQPTLHNQSRIEDAGEVAAALTEDGETLMNAMNAQAYNRSAIDLAHTSRSYVKVYQAVVEDYSARDYAGVNAGIEEMKSMEKWMRGYLAEIGSVLNDTQQQSRALSDRLRDAYDRRMAVMSILILAMCGITLVLTARRVVRPVEHLCRVVTHFRLSDDPVQLREAGVPCRTNSLREIRTLATAIYSMQDTVLTQYTVEKSNERLQKRLKDEALHAEQIEKQLRETQLKALQAQINPHFLFNTLNMIAQMSYIEGAEHTTELLETFSEYFRYNVEKFESNVTLAEEIANVRGYIQLQKERFGDRIQYEVEMDAELACVVVPCLVIQPLVENAVSHGLRMRTGGGLIRVAVQRRADGGFDISVADNGCGMDAGALRLLTERAEEKRTDDASAHRSIGISNVLRRLRIAFGERACISAESRPGEGTRVTLSVKGEAV